MKASGKSTKSAASNESLPVEWLLYGRLRDLIIKHVGVLEKRETLTKDDVFALEKLSSAYSKLKEDLRRDYKEGIWKRPVEKSESPS